MNVTGSQEQLIRLAEGVRELYLALADRFAETEQLRALWHDLARGEAEQATGLRRLAPAVAVSGGPDDPVLAEVLLRHLASLAERVRRDRLSPEGALALAFGVECSLAERLAAVVEQSGAPAAWLDPFRAAGREHRQKLRDAAALRGVFLPPDE
ncbi:MAG TPA: hypothetical protein PLY66_03660 [Acidobacteriota bacterium]|nr:hypothetical protein [Acidobacteriota bacterium]HOT00081.1 hypothetical protein [Acidobacteriota bacterium]HQF87751.1 hypothetical protein [Acidobacteriota bacterium]HQG92467.1 hypothetical protein [Acidobacteriota bacterium]HQK87706.1 hypothetical protein [Acidobacteriota bacterium]